MKKYTIKEVAPIALQDKDALLVHHGGYDWEQTANERQDKLQELLDNAPKKDVARAIRNLVATLNGNDFFRDESREIGIALTRGSL